MIAWFILIMMTIGDFIILMAACSVFLQAWFLCIVTGKVL